MTVIARALCATAQSEQAAMTMAALWGEQVDGSSGRRPASRGRAAAGGGQLLAVSCWDGEGTARAALVPLLAQVASSHLDALLAKPLSCRLRTL